MVDLINYTKYFESPLERNLFINEFLINDKKISGIKAGKDEEGYFVKYQEKMA